jgi:hypothetical protein
MKMENMTKQDQRVRDQPAAKAVPLSLLYRYKKSEMTATFSKLSNAIKDGVG